MRFQAQTPKSQILNTRYKILISWIAPLVFSGLIFGLVRPTLARITEGNAGLAKFLASNNIEVGDEIGKNGFRQIYYVWQGTKNFITDTNYTNGEPDTEGEYITWMGLSGLRSWQIFLYHIPTGITTQLTTSSNNANPKVSNGKVVWERWVGGKWQIFLFDGARILQLTEGNLSTDPHIEGDLVTYSRKNAAGTPRKDTYSIPSSADTGAHGEDVRLSSVEALVEPTPPTVALEEIAKELGAAP